VYADLTVGSRTVKSEILITPNRKGLILGVDWLRQQGYFQWDFDKGRIRFGEEDWIELCQEKRSILRIRPVLSDLNEESDSTLESNYVPVRRRDQENPFSVSMIVRGSNYAEYDELPVPAQRKLDEFLSPVQRKLDEDCVPVQYEDERRCKSELDSTSASEPVCISNSTSTATPVGGDRPVRAKYQCFMKQYCIVCLFSSRRRTFFSWRSNQSSKANSRAPPTRIECY